jgi:hypothetical protein
VDCKNNLTSFFGIDPALVTNVSNCLRETWARIDGTYRAPALAVAPHAVSSRARVVIEVLLFWMWLEGELVLHNDVWVLVEGHLFGHVCVNQGPMCSIFATHKKTWGGGPVASPMRP